MKLRIPSRVIEVCDACRSKEETLLWQCVVCGRRVCLNCSSRPSGFYGENFRICSRCIMLPEVLELNVLATDARVDLTKRYADKLRALGRRLGARRRKCKS